MPITPEEPTGRIPAYGLISAALTPADAALFDDLATSRLATVLPSDEGLLAVAAVERETGRALAIAMPDRLIVLRLGPGEDHPPYVHPYPSTSVMDAGRGALVLVTRDGRREIGRFADGYAAGEFARRTGCMSGQRSRASYDSAGLLAAAYLLLFLAFMTAGFGFVDHSMPLVIVASTQVLLGVGLIGANSQLARIRKLLEER